MDIGLTFLGILLFLTSVFMMLLILVQRGKGGGLTGALGGMGGQSAFGSKAGDVFTRITVVTAVIWIMLCMMTIAVYNPPPRDANALKDAPSMSSTDEESEDNAGGMGGMDSGEGEAVSGDNEASDTTATDADATNPDDPDSELEGMLDTDVDAPANPETVEGEGADEAAENESDDSGPGLEDQNTKESSDESTEESNDNN